MSGNDVVWLPEVIVFAGLNGSGKSTITRMAKIGGEYINADINVARVNAREALGGHGVPEEKIRSRYDKALALIPKFVEICDILHIYDNTQEPFRIFKKRKDVYYHWSNQYWSNDDIKKLSGIEEFVN